MTWAVRFDLDAREDEDSKHTVHTLGVARLPRYLRFTSVELFEIRICVGCGDRDRRLGSVDLVLTTTSMSQLESVYHIGGRSIRLSCTHVTTESRRVALS